MTSRDLYAACVGLSGGLAAQCVVHYLLRPSIGLALCLVTLMMGFVISVTLHVTKIVRSPVTTPLGTNSKPAHSSDTTTALTIARTAKRTKRPVPTTARADDAKPSARVASLAVSQ